MNLLEKLCADADVTDASSDSGCRHIVSELDDTRIYTLAYSSAYSLSLRRYCGKYRRQRKQVAQCD